MYGLFYVCNNNYHISIPKSISHNISYYISMAGKSDFTTELVTMETNTTDAPKDNVSIRALCENQVNVTKIVLGIIGVILNSLIIVGIKRSRKKLNSHMLLVMNLCISDLCAGVIGVVNVSVHQMAISYREGHGHISLQVYAGVLMANILYSSVSHVTVLTIMIMSLDHYLAVFSPLRYQALFPRRRAFIASIASWLVPMLYGGTLMAAYPLVNITNNRPRFAPYGYWIVGQKTCTTLAILSIITSVLITYTYTRVLNTVRHLLASSAMQDPNSSRLQRNKNATLTTVLILIVFLISWLPYSVLRIWYYYHRSTDIFVTLLMFANIMPFINIICDPLIYAARLTKVRGAVFKIFGFTPSHAATSNTMSTSENITRTSISLQPIM